MVSRIPLPHIGTDIVHIPRIHNLIQRQHGRHGFKFVWKLLNPVERSYWRVKEGLKQLRAFQIAVEPRPDPSHPGGPIKSPSSKEIEALREDLYPFARFLSGRWAAKEAVVKAYSNIRPISRENVYIYARTGPKEASLPPFACVSFQDLVRKTELEIRADGWFDAAWAREDLDIPADQEDMQKPQKDTQEGKENKEENQVNIQEDREDFSMGSSDEYGEEDGNETKKGAARPDANRPAIGEEEMRMVRLSISHDEDYATAVCLAAE